MDFLEGLDQGLLNGLQGWRTPFWDSVLIQITKLGNGQVLAGSALVTGIILLLRRRAISSLLLCLTVIAAFGMTEGVKQIVRRPRPDLAKTQKDFVDPTSFSFPSGHALESSAIYLSIALLVPSPSTRRTYRLALVAGASAVALLIGFSRLYLGVHYFSDVCGGLAAGLALALLCYRISGENCEEFHAQSE